MPPSRSQDPQSAAAPWPGREPARDLHRSHGGDRYSTSAAGDRGHPDRTERRRILRFGVPDPQEVDGVGFETPKARHEAGPPCKRTTRQSRLPRKASLMPPMAFWILPPALSILPSPSSLESPKTLPAPSLRLPLTFFMLPLTRSSSI